MQFRSWALALVMFVFTVGSIVAQTSKGILAGTVRDTTGAGIPGANITITNQDTGETRSVKSESIGSYRADAISPGIYKLHAEASGFQGFDAKDIVVRSSIVTSFDPVVKVGSNDVTVEVEANSAQLKVYSMTGEEVHRMELKQKGAGQVQLSVRELASGVYVYRLFMNGKSVASKKLVLEK